MSSKTAVDVCCTYYLCKLFPVLYRRNGNLKFLQNYRLYWQLLLLDCSTVAFSLMNLLSCSSPYCTSMGFQPNTTYCICCVCHGLKLLPLYPPPAIYHLPSDFLKCVFTWFVFIHRHPLDTSKLRTTVFLTAWSSRILANQNSERLMLITVHFYHHWSVSVISELFRRRLTIQRIGLILFLFFY